MGTSLKLMRTIPSKWLFKLMLTGQLSDMLLWEPSHSVQLHRTPNLNTYEAEVLSCDSRKHWTNSSISPLCCSTDISFVKNRTSFISLSLQVSYKSILWLMQADKRRFIYCATIPTATHSKRKYFKGSLLLCDITTALPNRTDDLKQETVLLLQVPQLGW